MDASELHRLLPAPGLSEKHRDVLREAMRLVAERGYRGASLRELARRVGMRQPSLYHYFRSKDELVEQVLDHMSVVFRDGAVIPTPERLADVPHLVAHTVVALYEHTDWGLFVRFVLSLSSSEARWRPRLRELFADRSATGIAELMTPYVERGEISAGDAQYLVRMIINAVGLLMIEQQILYPGEPNVMDPHAFADFVARFAAAGLEARAR